MSLYSVFFKSFECCREVVFLQVVLKSKRGIATVLGWIDCLRSLSLIVTHVTVAFWQNKLDTREYLQRLYDIVEALVQCLVLKESL